MDYYDHYTDAPKSALEDEWVVAGVAGGMIGAFLSIAAVIFWFGLYLMMPTMVRWPHISEACGLVICSTIGLMVACLLAALVREIWKAFRE